jgi:Family of unknown function (DUF6118)
MDDGQDDNGQGDAAAEAFEGLRAEVTLLRRAVERLAAERAEVPDQPDYSETLGRIAKAAGATAARVDVLAKAAEDAVTPRLVADRIVAAGNGARAEDQRLIATARKGLEDVARELRGVVVSARRGDEQNRWLAWTAIGGVVAGIVLWIVFGGMIVRATPDRWQWPESMATRTLGGTTWEGARRLAAASYPDTWNAMVVGTVIGQGNQGALERCQQAADKAGATVRCTVRIRPAERK